MECKEVTANLRGVMGCDASPEIVILPCRLFHFFAFPQYVPASTAAIVVSQQSTKDETPVLKSAGGGHN